MYTTPYKRVPNLVDNRYYSRCQVYIWTSCKECMEKLHDMTYVFKVIFYHQQALHTCTGFLDKRSVLAYCVQTCCAGSNHISQL
jgi:hypothetical protein